MDPVHEELHDDLLATLATSRRLPPENDAALAAAFLDRLERRVDRNDGSVSEGHASHVILRFVEALTGCGSAVLGLGAIAYAFDALMSNGAIVLGSGYSQQHGVAEFNHMMSILGPFMAVTAMIFVVIGIAAYLHAIRDLRWALRVLGGGTVSLMIAALVAIAYPGDSQLAFLLGYLLPPSFIPHIALATVMLALVSFLAGSSSQSLLPSRPSPRRKRRLARGAATRHA